MTSEKGNEPFFLFNYAVVKSLTTEHEVSSTDSTNNLTYKRFCGQVYRILEITDQWSSG